ncbi:riboflavin synthase [Aquibacillus kalidii]|uniref:riboflavin synthase n=1 Tax=Aquibacillus kalidii TaxID=2762597 RepID=UPI0016483F07|nr:riboflavin synthase [Aquibacillus kalidii]
MFTGIVEEKGIVKQISKKGNSLSLTIKGSTVTSDVHNGDSIAVNGVCLTVTDFGTEWFSVDVIPETFRGSSLAKLDVGKQVNLERAMSANGRFGGHFVSGHIDTTGVIKRIWEEDNARYVEVSVSQEGLSFIARKGSICVDGTSLTVFGFTESSFIISLIPETRNATIIGDKRQGDLVNVEYDMLAKYMARLLDFKSHPIEKSNGELTIDKLRDYGF